MTSGEPTRLRDIRLRALRDAPTAFGSSYEFEAAYDEAAWCKAASRWCRPGHSRGLVATLGGEDVGLVGCFRDKDGHDWAWIASMWVSPAARRRGVGRLLLGHAVGWARGIEVGSVRLHVTRGNDAARRLYEGVGFAATGGSMPHPRYAELVEDEMSLCFGRP